MTTTPTLPKTYQGCIKLHDDPLIAYIDNVLDQIECDTIIELAKSRMSRAEVSAVTGGTISMGRTGSNCWLPHNSHPTVMNVSQRIADIIGIPLQHAEALQVVHYGPNEEYRPHYDGYDLGTEKGQRCCARGGQRMVTALVYLNNVVTGGATGFPRVNTEISPRQGRMAIFHNCIPGTTDVHKDSLHAGTPVISGEKWAVNIWFRAHDMKQRLTFPAITPLTERKDWYLTNRASDLFESALTDLAPELDDQVTQPFFTYWDEYGNNMLVTDKVPSGATFRRLISGKILSSLSNKRSLAQSILKHGLQHLAPATCLTRDEAIAEKTVPLWFIKSPTGTGGRNMQVIRHENLGSATIADNAILQAAIDDLHLIDGRKFTTRIYALIWNGGVWLYREGFNVIHGVPYDPVSDDYAVQIDHRGYEKKDSPVSIQPFADLADSDRFRPCFRQLIQDLEPVFEPCLNVPGKQHYVLLGIDVLLQNSGKIQLVEINTIPNFRHTAEINRDINIPFFKAAIRTIYGLEDPSMTQVIEPRIN